MLNNELETKSPAGDAGAEERLSKEIAYQKSRVDEYERLHNGGCREAYKILGLEDDGEYRWKWVLLGLSDLKQRAELAEAQRRAAAAGGGGEEGRGADEGPARCKARRAARMGKP